jgi:hypothetical protein
VVCETLARLAIVKIVTSSNVVASCYDHQLLDSLFLQLNGLTSVRLATF